MNSWSKDTKLQYKTHIEIWLSYCKDNGIDPFGANIYQEAEFLVAYFRSSSTEYSSINTAKSALSFIIKPINGISFGKHPLISRIMKEII